MAFFFGIEGAYGTGKSLTAVIKSTQWALASGAKIFANFPMRGAYLFDSYEDWYKIADVHGSILIFDESQNQMDNRSWNGHGQIVMSQIMNYVRKMNSIFIFILPDYNNIDSRVRNMTNILIRCSKTPQGTIINSIYDFQEKQYGEYGKLLNKWVLPKESQKKIHALNLYDTNSMVYRFPMPPVGKQTEEFFQELMRRHENALARYPSIKPTIETLSKEDLLAYVS